MGFTPEAVQFKWDAIIMPSLRRFYAVHGHTDVLHSFVVPSGDATWPTAAWGWKLGHTVDDSSQGKSFAPQLDKSSIRSYVPAPQRHKTLWHLLKQLGREDIEKLGELGVNVKLSARAWQTRVAPLLDIYLTMTQARGVPEEFVIPSKAPWPEKMWGVRLGLIVARNSHHLPRQLNSLAI
ncbi:hypothetical protein PHYPSEUDO_008553 [Phytophthora pseudosyringae]|uniref:Helicase-associated domain-containing protein n=1 Tax=Phytophthora pseudosyringae TaxID=221518 RepID=A0A8T1VH31_9STRA|nr:hypothetical protein PHYPSEUDO_008553 [Phytophthora pseudosyringae]